MLCWLMVFRNNGMIGLCPVDSNYDRLLSGAATQNSLLSDFYLMVAILWSRVCCALIPRCSLSVYEFRYESSCSLPPLTRFFFKTL